MQTPQELYSEQIQKLPPAKQLQLATLILQGLNAAAAMAVPYYSDEWTDEDLEDFAIFSLKYAAESFGEE